MKSARLRRLLAAALLLAAVPLAASMRSWIVADHVSPCIFRSITGRPCPLCGMTRAMAHAGCGDFGQAWQSHPLWPVLALIMAGLAASLLLDGIFGTSTSTWVIRVLERGRLPLIAALVALELWRLS
ncbi:MAG TPA: DUF2752 domain-containing protein [Roseiflexaceae bacterium]|jgi:hypothetical protein